MIVWDTLTPLVEIMVIAVILNYLLSFFWNTRAMDLLYGLVALLGLFWVSSLFDWPVLQKLLLLFFNVAAIAILILFQPELQMALSKLSLKGRRTQHGGEFEKYLDELTESVYRLAESQHGALIVLEHQDSLEKYAQKAVLLQAKFSGELLETIFQRTAPLHDGAVILRGHTVLAAGAILPLAEEGSQLARWMGTRHRAALGMSQVTDALIIAVSEESGKVSIAREGIMTRGIKPDRFKGILRSLFIPQTPSLLRSLAWKDWLPGSRLDASKIRG